MEILTENELAALSGGTWLADFGAGLCCGVAVGAAVMSGGLAIPLAIGTCLWALG